MENSTLKTGAVEDLLTVMSECFEYAKGGMAQLTQEQSMAVMMPVVTGDGKIGEDHSMGAMIIKMIAPMVFGLVLYKPTTKIKMARIIATGENADVLKPSLTNSSTLITT